MTVTYKVIYSDYLEAQRLLRYTKLERYNSQLILKWIIPALRALFIALAILQLHEQDRDVSAPFFGAAFGAILLVVPLWRGRRLRRCYEAQRMGSEVRVSVEQDGIEIEATDNSANSAVKWAVCEQSLESNKVFMLLMGNAHMLIVPKSALNATDVDELRDTFARQIADFRQVK